MLWSILSVLSDTYPSWTATDMSLLALAILAYWPHFSKLRKELKMQQKRFWMWLCLHQVMSKCFKHWIQLSAWNTWNTENSTWSQSSTLSSCTGLFTHCTFAPHPLLKQPDYKHYNNLGISDQGLKCVKLPFIKKSPSYKLQYQAASTTCHLYQLQPPTLAYCSRMQRESLCHVEALSRVISRALPYRKETDVGIEIHRYWKTHWGWDALSVCYFFM